MLFRSRAHHLSHGDVHGIPPASAWRGALSRAAASARGPVAPGAGDSGCPLCPGPARPGTRRSTTRVTGGLGHHSQTHRAGNDGAVAAGRRWSGGPYGGTGRPSGSAYRDTLQVVFSMWRYAAPAAHEALFSQREDARSEVVISMFKTLPPDRNHKGGERHIRSAVSKVTHFTKHYRGRTS